MKSTGRDILPLLSKVVGKVELRQAVMVKVRMCVAAS